MLPCSLLASYVVVCQRLLFDVGEYEYYAALIQSDTSLSFPIFLDVLPDKVHSTFLTNVVVNVLGKTSSLQGPFGVEGIGPGRRGLDDETGFTEDVALFIR